MSKHLSRNAFYFTPAYALGIFFFFGVFFTLGQTPSDNELKITQANKLFSEAQNLISQNLPESLKAALPKLEEARNLYREAGDKANEVMCLGTFGTIYSKLGDNQKTLDYLNQALPIAKESGNKALEAAVIYSIGIMYSDSGDNRKALDYFNQALLLRRETGNKEDEIKTIRKIAGVYADLNESRKALELYSQLLALQKETDKKDRVATTLNQMGFLYNKLGENQKALDCFNQSLILYKELTDKDGEAALLNNIAFIYNALGNREKSLEYYNLALPLRLAAGNKKEEAVILHNIGRIYFDLGDRKKALEYFNQALPLAKEVGDKRQEEITLVNIGGVYWTSGYGQKALSYYLEALALQRELDDKSEQALTLNKLGLIYQKLGEMKKALEYFNQSLILKKQLGQKEDETATLSNIGEIYSDLGDYQKALEYFKQALLLSRDTSNKKYEAAILSNIGKVYLGLSENRKALDYLNQALLLHKDFDDRSGEAAVFINIGSTYTALGEKQKALEYYNRALALQNQLGNKLEEAITLNNIGNVYLDLGESQKALDYFNQALLIDKEFNNKRGEAFDLNNIGVSYDKSKESQKALNYYHQALTSFKEIGDKSGEASSMDNVGTTYTDLKENQKALDYFNQALSLQKEIGNKSGEATTLNNIGGVYINLGELRKALDYINQTLLLARFIGAKELEAKSLSNIMGIWDQLKNRKLAAFYGKQSVSVFQQMRSNIKGLDKAIQQSYLKSVEDTYRYLADVLIADSRLTEAQGILDLLKNEEFSGLVRRSGEISQNIPYSKAEDAAIKVVDQLAALGREKGELTEKNEKGTLSETERVRYRELDKQITLGEAEFNKSLTALAADSGSGQNLETVTANAQALMEDLRGLGSGTVALYTVLVNDSKPNAENIDKTKEPIKEQIKSGWIILVTPEFRKAYPIDVTNLEQTVFTLRAALSSPKYDPQPMAQEMYKKMFLQTSDKQKTTLAADLDEYFKGKTGKTLMWSLDGVLRYIPMAALHDGKNYLVEKYRNTIFTTASIGRLNVPLKSKWTVLGLGVSERREESGKTFPALDGAKRELQTIVRSKDDKNSPGILTGTVLMDGQFTQDAMFDSLSFDKNPVVHIASHFSYDPADFDKSFLLLGTGKLTVEELSNKTTLFSNIDLLTLSACETAVGSANGKEVEGFAFKAQKSGAKAVLATLWQVDDIGTQVLMPEFYRLHETGLGKAEALRQAQIALLQGKIKDVPKDVKRAELVGTTDSNLKLELYQPEGKPPFAHPYYWSPFVLIGNWK